MINTETTITGTLKSTRTIVRDGQKMVVMTLKTEERIRRVYFPSR